MSSNVPMVLQRYTLCLLHEARDPQASYATAIRENPLNAVVTPTRASNRYRSLDDREPRLLIAHTRYWAGGRTLKIGFMNNPPEFITAPIIAAASKWLPHISLKFEFITQGVSDIRILVGWRATGAR